MKFDWTISFGTVLHLVGMGFIFIAAYFKLVAHIGRVEALHLVEAAHIQEIKADIKELKRETVAGLESRIRVMEIKLGSA